MPLGYGPRSPRRDRENTWPRPMKACASAKFRSSANACSHSAMPWAARFVNIWTTPRSQWARACCGARDRALVKAVSAAARRAARSSVKRLAPVATSTLRHADQRFDIFGIERQGAFEKAARLRHVFGGQPLVQPSPALENTSPSHRDAANVPPAAPQPQ